MTILSDQAKFTINGTPAEDPVTGDPGFDGTHSQTLTLTLENSPSGALAVTYEVYDPTDGNSPLASKDAPLLTFVDSGTARQYLTNPNGNATIILPGSGVHSYTFRCTAHFDGDDHVFERVVSIRTTTLLPNVRKLVPAESTQYAAQTWSETQNEIVDALSAAAFIAGSVNYQGTWNANTNTPALASGVGTKGYYYVVSVAGTTNLDGITDWEQNDWAIFNGTVWQKVDNSDIYWWDRTGTVLAPLMTGDTVSIPGTDSVVTLLSVVQTPPAPTTNIVTSIEAQGTNWAAGSRVLQLISDDADAVPLAINDGAADVLTVSRGAVIARDSGTITVQTTTSGNIVIDSAAVVDINAATTVTIDATAGQVSIDAAQSSNFSVSGASQALTLSATGGTNASVIINTNGAPTNAVDINATAGGVEIDAAKASHFVVAGADLTLQTTGSGDVIADGAANVLLNVATSTVMTISATGATMAAGATINEFSTDGTLGGASDTALPTERAVKTYVDTTAAAAAAGVSLDDAYDSGGAGAGRTITADTGAVNIVDDDTTAGLLTVVQTPTGGIVETVVSLESQGTNWSSGSRVLQIVSDDNDAVPFVVNNGASDVAGITRTGAIGAGMLPSTAMLEVKSSGVSSNALRIENSADTDALLLVQEDSGGDARLYLYDDGANVGVRLGAAVDSYFMGGKVGIGIDSPDTLLHVESGTAGTVTAVGNTKLTVEADNVAYISILTPDANERGIIFGEPASNVAGGIIYNTSTNTDGLQFRVSSNTPAIDIESDGTLHALTTDYETLVTDDDDIPNKKYVDDAITSSDEWTRVSTYTYLTNAGDTVGIGVSDPAAKLHIQNGDTGATYGSVEMIVESTADSQLEILSGTSNNSIIYFGDGDDPDEGRIDYDNDAETMTLSTNSSTALHIDSSGQLGVGLFTGLSAMVDVKSSGTSSNPFRIENSEDTDALLLVTQDSSDHARLYLYDASANVGVRLCAGTYSYIDSGGNLGIGTAADSGYRLEVQVDSDTAYSATAVPSTQGAMIYNSADGAVHDTFSSLVLNARADAKNSVIAFNAIQPDDTLSGSELAIQRRTDSDTYAESVRIDKIGSVGVNTMTPGTWANAPVPTASMLHVQTDTSTTGSYLPALYVVGAGDADDSGVMARFGTANDRGLEIKAGRRISDQAHVDFGVVTADGAARHTLTLIQETGGTVTRIGGRMTAPEFDFHTMQDENALSGTDVDVSELGFVVTRYANDNNHAVGIGFGNSTDTSNVGAAIIHERVGGESQGKLHFATKDTAIADDDIPIVFTLDEAGKAGLGITSPLTELHVQTADLGTGWDDTDASAQIAAVGDDAGVTIVSTDAGTWGSAISFAQVDGTVFENKWAIGRQTNGDGSGDGSLHVQYGTDARGMRNTSVLAISSAGVVTSYYGGVVKDDMNWAFGDDSNAAIQYDTTQTPDSWLFGVSTDSNALIVCQKADMGYDFAHALETDPTVFIQSANQSATEWRSFTHNQTDAYSGIGSGSHVTNHEAPVLLADDASFTLPADSYGWGTFYFHNDGSYAQVAWAADGTVTLIANSANVDDADTDTYYCIYDAGSNTVAVKNRIGASRYVMFDYHYSTATYA